MLKKTDCKTCTAAAVCSFRKTFENAIKNLQDIKEVNDFRKSYKMDCILLCEDHYPKEIVTVKEEKR